MNEEEVKDIEEVIDNPLPWEGEEKGEEKKELPEAPVSITVRGYYKGFSVLITKRNAEGKVELDKIIEAIDNMVGKGFKPSWNDDTNHTNGTTKPVTKQPIPIEEFDAQQEQQNNCPHTQFKLMQSHSEKNPGRWFKTCESCKKFLGWVEVK